MKTAKMWSIISAAVFFAAASFSGCSTDGSSAEYGNALKFSSEDRFSIKTANESKNWNGTLEYSTDKEIWTEWNGESINSGTDNEIYFRGTENTYITGDYGKNLVITPEEGHTVSCTGNIENLLDYNDVKEGKHPFMADYCYCNMFSGCTSLSAAPELHADQLAEGCYSYMFYGCTGLTTAPELPAAQLADYCYSYMFSGCTSLSAAPELPADQLAESCYFDMFSGCTSLSAASKLPAAQLADYCYRYMFYGCTGLTTAPELPAAQLAEGCYSYMFYGCTGLTTAPELPAAQLADYCYRYMFYGCKNLNYIKMMAADIYDEYSSLKSWVSGVAATGTFVKNLSATWDVTGINGVPSGWTVETASE